MSYQVQWQEKGIYCKFSGTVTGEDIIQCNMDLYGDIRFDELFYQILDFQEMTELKFNNDDVELIAACDRAAAESNPHIMCAVIGSDSKLHDLSNFYRDEIDTIPWEAQAFTTLGAALEWLNQGGKL